MKKLSQSRLADTVMNGRKDKGMTQAQLADATGINRALISRIEQKDFVPSIEQLESLSEVLNFDLTDMFINAGAHKLESPSPLNIAVAGTGYVGLSIATLLAQHNHVTRNPLYRTTILRNISPRRNLISQQPSMAKQHTRMQIS